MFVSVFPSVFRRSSRRRSARPRPTFRGRRKLPRDQLCCPAFGVTQHRRSQSHHFLLVSERQISEKGVRVHPCHVRVFGEQIGEASNQLREQDVPQLESAVISQESRESA